MSSTSDRPISRFVPGVARPVGPPRPAPIDEPAEPDPVAWDASPLLKRNKRTQEETEFFKVSALARALRRTVHTIYKWEQKGFIPKATYGYKVDGALGGGRRRLYTRWQIEGLIRISKEEGVYGSRPPVLNHETNFAQRARRLFKGDLTA